MTGPPDSRDISNPLFVRFYRRNRQTAAKRGENEHRQRSSKGSRAVSSSSAPVTERTSRCTPARSPRSSPVEPEPRFRAQAERAARDASVYVRVEPGTAEQLRLPPGSVDAVVASLVLCTAPDQAMALREARRVLHPGTGIWPRIAGGCHPTREASPTPDDA